MNIDHWKILHEILHDFQDGVDAPPEEELLDEGSLGPTENRIWSETNGLTHQLHDGRMSNSTVETAQDAGGNVQGPFQDLSIAGSLLSQQSKQVRSQPLFCFCRETSALILAHPSDMFVRKRSHDHKPRVNPLKVAIPHDYFLEVGLWRKQIGCLCRPLSLF